VPQFYPPPAIVLIAVAVLRPYCHTAPPIDREGEARRTAGGYLPLNLITSFGGKSAAWMGNVGFGLTITVRYRRSSDIGGALPQFSLMFGRYYGGCRHLFEACCAKRRISADGVDILPA
jgi:hypothetical protein